MPEIRARVAPDMDEHVVTVDVPEWFLAFVVDAHRIVTELHAINATLMQIAKRDIERKRTVSDGESCPTT